MLGFKVPTRARGGRQPETSLSHPNVTIIPRSNHRPLPARARSIHMRRMETSLVHNAPVFSPNAELRDALKDWSRAVDALHESQTRSRLEGDANVTADTPLVRRINSARVRCELLIKFNPRSAFEPGLTLAGA